jgi:hypothetical protein
MSKAEISLALLQREPADRLRMEDLKFCEYRLNILRAAPDVNRAVIEAVEQRIRDLQYAA